MDIFFIFSSKHNNPEKKTNKIVDGQDPDYFLRVQRQNGSKIIFKILFTNKGTFFTSAVYYFVPSYGLFKKSIGLEKKSSAKILRVLH